jgi:CHAT domain-containing protein/tetratricopeptide (TPR) repeat protein
MLHYRNLCIGILFVLLCHVTLAQQQRSSFVSKLDQLASEPYSAKSIIRLESLLKEYAKTYSKEDSITAMMLHRLADFHRLGGDYQQAIALLQYSIRINRSLQAGTNESYLANSYFNMGLYHSLLGLDEDALKFYDSCLFFTQKYPEKSEEALYTYNKLSHFYGESGDFQRSIDLADYGLALSNGMISQQIPMLLAQKSNALLGLGKIDLAEQNIHKALSIQQNQQDAGTASFLYSTQAQVFKNRGQFSEAIANYEKAYQLNMQSNDAMNAISILNNLGLLYEESLGDPVKGLRYYQDALEMAKQMGNQNQIGLVMNNLGTLFFYISEYSKAAEYYQKGLEELVGEDLGSLPFANPKAEKLNSLKNLQILYVLLRNKGESLMESYKSENQDKALLQAALETFHTADKVVDRMRWNQQAQTSKLYWRTRTKSMYEDALEVAFLLQDMESAFFFMEKSRAVLLNDRLSELGANQMLQADDLDRKKSLRLNASMALSKLDEVNDSKNQKQYFEAQKAYQDYVKSLEIKYPVYFKYKYDTAIIHLDQLADMLATDQAYVAYFSGSKANYVFAQENGIGRLKKIEDLKLDEKIAKLLQLSGNLSALNKSFATYVELASELYGLLFQPMEIASARVVVSPDEWMLPMEMLLKSPQDPSSYLLKDHAFSYTYSAGFLAKATKSFRSGNHSLLGMAPVSYQPQLKQASLLGADMSLKKLVSFFPKAELFVNDKATKKEFINALQRHSIIQLYSHAVADSLDTEPAIYFHDDKLLLSELQYLDKLPTQLIGLSACNTGIGKSIKGEGIFSLARGFAAAGIPASLTTLWEVDDQATYMLTEYFYSFLSEGLPADVALQQAKLQFLASHEKRHQLPYYWSGAVLFGSSPVLIPQAKHYWLYLILGLGFILAILIWRWKKSNTYAHFPISSTKKQPTTNEVG